jgi:hypothetical protein
MFPRTTPARLKGRDADGWNSGREAAEHARIARP